MRPMFLCATLLAIAPLAHAGAIVWIAGTGTWNTPGNWSSGDVPDMLGDVAVIPLDTAVVNLNISPTIDGHQPSGGETYSIITTTNHPGRFAAFDLPPLPLQNEWSVEYLPAAVRLKVSPFCFGDSDFNNTVNFADITAVLTNFGADYSPAPGTGPGDSTRDGIVNFADITNTLANFNGTCP